ncbi:hypothetical protein [Sphingobium sp. SCG-1]|uniref:hypothetical protein n=1 Tax=Sphingobium sp. SCG-1 TaxID=2072936 RepID=UPI00166FB4ED|nr:hypothetical protein [Sphingobium sp. SCG-1]
MSFGAKILHSMPMAVMGRLLSQTALSVLVVSVAFVCVDGLEHLMEGTRCTLIAEIFA